MADRLLQLQEVAERTTFSENTLRYWRQKGQGPRAVKIGRRLVYRESDVDAWIAEQFAEEVPIVRAAR